MIAVCECVAEAPPAEAGEAEAEYPAAWHAPEALEAEADEDARTFDDGEPHPECYIG